ncbi:MAG: leucine-rich repeat protein [Velocimicrobium sp.]
MKKSRKRKEMGKRLLSVILCCLLVITLVPVSVFASVGGVFDDSGSGLRFKVLTEDGTSHTGTVAVVPNNYSGTVYNIPETVTCNGIIYTVTEIGEKAFFYCETLTKVIIEENSQLTAIGDSAFYNTALKEILIPAGVTSIGNNAFCFCETLTKVTIEENSQLTIIGDSAFNYDGLNEITIPAEVTSIGDFAFDRCENLTQITFAENSKLETIGENAFQVSGLTGCITIPASVKTINKSAFLRCPNLTKVTFAENSKIETIGESAFYDSALKEITVSAGVTSIGDSAFENCSALSRVTFLGSTPPTIGADAFLGITALAFTVPTGTVEVYKAVLPADATVDIPPSISDVTVSPDMVTLLKGLKQTFSAIVSGTGSFSQDVTWSVAQGSSGTMIDANGELTVAADETAATLTVTATSAADTTKTGTAVITVVDLPTVGDEFDDSASGLRLKVLTVDGATHTGTAAVIANSYSGTAYTIPSTVDYNGITCTVTEIGKYAFRDCTALTKIIIEENSKLTSIGDYAFYNNTALEEIMIPSGVTSIGEDAFFLCEALTKVTIGDNSQLTTIGTAAFDCNFALKEITIPARVTSIGDYAFDRCEKLTQITFAENSKLETIGTCAFQLSGLTGSITIPASVKTINDSAFRCPNLTKVTFAENSKIEEIGTNAFYDSALQEITIPAGVTSIGKSAFENCSALSRVTFLGSTPPTIGADAFLRITALAFTVPAGTVEAYKAVLPANAVIMVPVSISKVTVSPDTVTLVKGSKQTFIATVTGTGSFSQDVTWSVTGGSLGTTIDANGVLTVAADEMAVSLTVTATLVADTTQKGTATIIVSDTPANNVPTAKSLVQEQKVASGSSIRFTASNIAEDADNDKLTIINIVTNPNTSTASAILIGDTVEVTGIGEGSTWVTVTVSDGKDSVEVTVPITVTALPNIAEISDVTISPETVTLTRGSTQKFSAKVTGTGSFCQDVTWSVTDGRLGTTMDGNGVLTLAADEIATTLTVTATSVADTTKKGTAIITVIANSYGGYSGGTSVTPQPEKSEEQPVIATASLTPTVDKKGKATLKVLLKTIKATIKKAVEETEDQEGTENGIGVTLQLKNPKNTKSLDIVLKKSVMNQLTKAKVEQFEVEDGLFTIQFDLKALKEIKKKSTGDVTIHITPVTGLSKGAKALIGKRPVYKVTLNYSKNGKTKKISKFESGSVTLSIPYTPGENETTGNLYAVYINGKGKAVKVSNSSYDEASGSVMFTTDRLAVYGVGYTAD